MTEVKQGVQHTQGEWRWVGNTLEGPGPDTILSCSQFDPEPPSDADKARIVLCVNNFDALAAALSTAMTLLRTHVDPESLGGTRFDLSDCHDMQPIFAALAATGEKK